MPAPDLNELVAPHFGNHHTHPYQRGLLLPVRTAIAQQAEVSTHRFVDPMGHAPPLVDPHPAQDPTYNPDANRRPLFPGRRRAAQLVPAPPIQRQPVVVAPVHAPAQTASYSGVGATSTLPALATHGTTSAPTATPVMTVVQKHKEPVLRRLVDTFERGLWLIRDFGALAILRRIGLGISGIISVWVVGFLALSIGPGLQMRPVATQAAAANTTNNAATPAPSAAPSQKPTNILKQAAPGAAKGLPIVEGVPPQTMALYVGAARTCGVPWTVLAAIGKVETNHGQSTATGVTVGANAAGAQGPMQFMPGTWAAYGVDANGDGKKNVYDPADAIYGAASYLCANGGNTESGLRDALWNYNHSTDYVNTVLDTARAFRANAYTTPVAADAFNPAQLPVAHIDVSAVDIPLPQHTPVIATHLGRARTINTAQCPNGVELVDDNAVTYRYCNGEGIDISNGAVVNAGDVLMYSGPGSTSANGTEPSTPYLHFEIEVAGGRICPQPVLDQWIRGQYVNLDEQPTGACTTPR